MIAGEGFVLWSVREGGTFIPVAATSEYMIERITVKADEMTREVLALEFVCISRDQQEGTVTLAGDGDAVSEFIETSHDAVTAESISTTAFEHIDEIPQPLEWDILGCRLPIDEYVTLTGETSSSYNWGDSLTFGPQTDRTGDGLSLSAVRSLEADGLLEGDRYEPTRETLFELYHTTRSEWRERLAEFIVGGTIQFPRNTDYEGVVQIDTIGVRTTGRCDAVRNWLDERYGYTTSSYGRKRRTPNSDDYPTATAFTQADDRTVVLQWDRVVQPIDSN